MTPGTAPATIGTVLPNSPFPVELAGVMMRSALIALSTLLVAELDSEAPNTAMADTSASPTISAAAVWAVRRGLRMEFSRPNRPEVPSRRASGRPMTLAIGRATAGASIATPTKIRTAPRPTSWIAGFESPTASSTIADRGDDTALGEAAPHGHLLLGLLLGDGRHRGDAHGAAGRADGGHERDPDAHEQADDDGARLEDEEPVGSVNPKPLSSFSSPTAASTPSPRPITRRHQPDDHRFAEHGAEHLAAAGPDDAQQRQLPRALADGDGERVQDGEAADEQCDEAEDQQRRVEDAQGLADRVRLLVDHGLARHHLDAVGQHGRDGALDRRLVGAGLR